MDKIIQNTKKYSKKRKVKSLNNNTSLVSSHTSTKCSKVLTFDAYGNLTANNDSKTIYSQSIPSIEEFNLILDSFERKSPKKVKEYSKQKSERSSKMSPIKQDNSLSENELRQVFKPDINMLATSRYGRTRKQRSADGFLFGTINFKELNKVTSSRKSSTTEEQQSDTLKNGILEPSLPFEIAKNSKDVKIEDIEDIEQPRIPLTRKRKSLANKNDSSSAEKKKKTVINKRQLSDDDKPLKKQKKKQSLEIPITHSLEEDLILINKCIEVPTNDDAQSTVKLEVKTELDIQEEKQEEVCYTDDIVKDTEDKIPPKILQLIEVKEESVNTEVDKAETTDLDSKINMIEDIVPVNYSCGDLVWVYIRGNPLWPSILTFPREMDRFSKIMLNYKKPMRLYHVLFLNDGGRTLWVNPRNMVLFKGKDKLNKFLDDIKEMEKEKKVTAQASNPMLKTLTVLQKANGNKYFKWQEAINYADKLFPLDNLSRLEMNYNMEDELEKTIKLKSPKSKKIKKKSKKAVTPKYEGKEEISIIEEISILEESSSEDEFHGFNNSLINEGKTKQKKLKEKMLDGFDVYLEKHLQAYMDNHIDFEKEKAIKILYNLFKKLNNLQKNKYRLMSGKKSNVVLDTDYSSDSSSSSNTYGSKKFSKGTYKIPRHEKVCHRCNGRREKDGSAIVRCKGVCNSSFHLSCLDLTAKSEADFKCVSCLSGIHNCFICKSSENKIVKCTVPHCGKYYHYECARKWPQVSKSRHTEKLVCPRHICHMCAANADDMNDLAAKTPPYTKCLLCPTTYHTGETCIAAGVEEITQQFHICTKHIDLSKENNHCNVNWCFCCSKGGSLLLCDQCPAAFHAECLNITAPEGEYVCEDCENGKLPTYGDVVWVKVGIYRWWPGQVQHPKYIPDNIENLPHKKGKFCVHFFGSDDYYWVSKGKVFLYQEGDQGSKGSGSRPIEQQFRKAMSEAVDAYREQKKRRDEQEATRSLKGNKKPPPYVRIEMNRPVGNVRLGKLDLAMVTKCECDPFSENPCSSDEKCLNRMLMVECIPQVCAGGDRCQNQRFQKRQYPSVQPFRTSARGWGLKTNEFIQKGEFIIEYVGELVDEQELKRRIREMHDCNEENYYFLTIDKEHIIDAGPKGNLSRFMNHSCQPNCETQKWTVGADTRVGLFAMDDIIEGSELIFNYNLECVGTDKKKCQCGASQCSGFIGAKVQKQEKSSKADMKKKKKRKKKDKKDTEDECFRCRGAGDLVLCDLSVCPKAYHLDCLNLKTLPKGKWICPWHHCDNCGSRAVNRCLCCPNSYCRLHSRNQFVDDEMKFCLDHDNDEIEKMILFLKTNGLVSTSNSSTTSREQTPDAH